LTVYVIAGNGGIAQAKSSTTSALVKYLIAAEDVNVRPNADLIDSPTVVSIGVSIFSIEKTLHKKNIVTVQGFTYLSWSNPRLAWNPLEYGNITSVRLPISSVWVPDITLYNSADVNEPLGSAEQKIAIVTSDGTTLWVPKTKHSFAYNKTAEVDGKTKLSTRLKFGSWVYSAIELDVQAKDPEIQKDVFSESSEYIVVNSSFEHHVKFYPCCVEGYPSLDLNLVLEKKED